jgi:cell division protein FtsA
MQGTQKYSVSLDIGSSKIGGIVYKRENNGNIKIISKQILNSSGFKAGNIINMDEAENSIMNMIYALENDSKSTFSSVDVSISGSGVKSYYIDHKIKIDSHVTQDTTYNLISAAIKKFNKAEYEVIQSFPIEFLLDGNIVENPNNMYCHELGCKLHVIVVEKHQIRNIINCLSKCGIKINKFISTAYAAGLACLSDDSKKLGSIIFELGAHTTSFGIFLNNKLIYTNNISIGSYHITSDISKALSISLTLAEKIKIMYGKVSPGNLMNQLINFSHLMQNKQEDYDLSITIGDLSSIIGPRIDEIIEMIKIKYDEIGIDNLISKHIYVTGGGANLEGIEAAFREHFKYQVHKTKPKLNTDSSKNNYNLQDAVLIGMTKCTYDSNKVKIINKSPIQKLLYWLKANI